MARNVARTAPCTLEHARTRLVQAEKYVEVAQLVLDEQEFAGVAASLAVLAGVAASDAACCARLGERHRGQSHDKAVELLATVEPGGPKLARDLSRLLQRKDDAHYGLLSVSTAEAGRMVSWASRMVDDVRPLLQA